MKEASRMEIGEMREYYEKRAERMGKRYKRRVWLVPLILVPLGILISFACFELGVLKTDGPELLGAPAAMGAMSFCYSLYCLNKVVDCATEAWNIREGYRDNYLMWLQKDR